MPRKIDIHFVTEDDDIDALSSITYRAYNMTELGRAVAGTSTDEMSGFRQPILDTVAAHKKMLSTASTAESNTVTTENENKSVPPPDNDDIYASARKDGLVGKVALCATVDDSDAGCGEGDGKMKPAGLAIWELPPLTKSQGLNVIPEPTALKAGMVPPGFNVDIMNSVQIDCTRDTKAKLGTIGTHYHLRNFVVDPSQQGHGIGYRLLKWGLDRADADGLSIFLHGSPEGYNLYKRNGFEQLGETIRTDGKWISIPMLRRPKPQQP